MPSVHFPLLEKPPPPLPVGWVQKWDQHYQRAYYVELKTGSRQWDAPAALKEKIQEHNTHVKCHACGSFTQSRDLNPKVGCIGLGERPEWAASDSEIDEVDRIV